MEEIITYLLKSSGLMAAFFLAYHFLLRKETFFTSNRWFLLSGLVTSALLPLYFIKKIVFIEKPKLSIEDLMALSNNASEAIPNIPATAPTIDWIQIVAFGYGIIVVFLFLKLVFNLFSIVKLIRNKVVNKNESFSLIDINQDITPFSFFNYIVFNSTLYSNQELESILLHEKVHSKQKHSFDVVVAQLFTIVFWINPIVWLYKKAIVQNLEFIADSKAIQNIEDKKCYQLALLKVVSHQNCLPITNPFYQSLIKKRIVMLNKNQSNKRNSWKYAVVIPALIAFVLLFQIQVVAQEKEEKETKEWTTNFEKGFNNSTSESIAMDSDDPDEGWYSLKNEFINKGITINVSNIKRNSENKIIAINILMKSENGTEKRMNLNQTKPIKAIEIYVNQLQNGKWDFGIKQIKNIDKGGDITPNESKDDDVATSIEKQENTWTINDMKENGKSFLLFIDGKKQDNAKPIKISNNREIDNLIKIKEADKLAKYGDEGKNGVALITTKIIDGKAVEAMDFSKEQLIIINGEVYNEKTLKELDPKYIVKMNVVKDKKMLEKYGDKGKNGVIIVTTRKFKDESGNEPPKIITLDNGDEIVYMSDTKAVKIPEHPMTVFTDNSPALIINGIEQSNPKAILEIMDVSKIKSLKGYDENGKETPGTPIKKIVITTR
jgi:hypothetical protein